MRGPRPRPWGALVIQGPEGHTVHGPQEMPKGEPLLLGVFLAGGWGAGALFLVGIPSFKHTKLLEP